MKIHQVLLCRERTLNFVLLILAMAYGFLAPVEAATPLRELRYSTDLTIELALPPLVVTDHEIIVSDLASTVSAFTLPTVPVTADVDAYHVLPNGDQLISFDTFVTLGTGVHVFPGDVVRFDGTTYSIAFQASARGLPAGVNVDAITADLASHLVLSFDTTVDLGGVLAQDEDLVLDSGTSLSIAFDGSAAGVPSELDLEGAHLLVGNGHWLLSFDGSFDTGGFVAKSGDILEYSPGSGTWELALPAAQTVPGGPSAGRVDAIYAKAVDNDGDGISVGDCNDNDPGVWAIPGEVTDVLLTHAGGIPGTTTILWTSPVSPGGTALVYDTLSAHLPDGFMSGVCVESGDGSDVVATDSTPLNLGEVLYFVTRGVNVCGDGTIGSGEGPGAGERSARACP